MRVQHIIAKYISRNHELLHTLTENEMEHLENTQPAPTPSLGEKIAGILIILIIVYLFIAG